MFMHLLLHFYSREQIDVDPLETITRTRRSQAKRLQ